MSAPVMARVAHAVAAIRDGLHVSNTVMKKLLQDVHDAAEAQPPAEPFVCTGDEIRCYDGNGCECAMQGKQPPAEAHCATCACVPGMTPAVRFDTTPAEQDGAVRDHLIRMGWTPPAEAQATCNKATDAPHVQGSVAQAQGGGELDYTDIANRAQEVTGRSIWPSTVKAVLEAAGSPAPDSCPRPTDVP